MDNRVFEEKMHGRLISSLDVRRFYHFIKNYYVLKNLPSNEEGPQEIFSPVIILGDNGQHCPHCGVRVKKLQKHIKKVHPQFFKPPIIPSANCLLRNPPPDPEDVMREIYGDW